MSPDVVNGENVWMVKGGGGPSFLFEAIQPVGIGGKVGREDFDRNVAVKSRVARPPDFAHTALANLRDDSVLSDGRFGGDGLAHGAYPQISGMGKEVEKKRANFTGNEDIGLEISDDR